MPEKVVSEAKCGRGLTADCNCNLEGTGRFTATRQAWPREANGPRLWLASASTTLRDGGSQRRAMATGARPPRHGANAGLGRHCISTWER